MKNSVLLLFTEVSDKGGIEVFSEYFLESIIKVVKSEKINLITINNKKLPQKFDKYNIKTYCCASRFKFFKKMKFLLFFLWNILFDTPNYIISNHISPLKIYIPFHPFLKINYCLVAYGIDVWHLNFLERKIVKNAKLIASFSKYTSSKIKNQVKVKGKIIYFPPVINKNKFYPKSKNKKLIKKYKLEGNKIILTVARLSSAEKYKGYDKVVKALLEIIKEIPNIKYLIAGKGDDLPRIKNLVKELNLKDYVIFCGFVPNNKLIDFYNICDVFVMPSKGEGFGIVFLEALACGKPVIAGNKDGSRDALLDGKLGILVDPDNIKEISNAIIKVLKKEIPEKLLDRKYLRKKVIEVYGIEKFRERTEKLIEKLRK